MKIKYTGTNEESMPQAQAMPLYEKLVISCKAAELRKDGNEEG